MDISVRGVVTGAAAVLIAASGVAFAASGAPVVEPPVALRADAQETTGSVVASHTPDSQAGHAADLAVPRSAEASAPVAAQDGHVHREKAMEHHREMEGVAGTHHETDLPDSDALAPHTPAHDAAGPGTVCEPGTGTEPAAPQHDAVPDSHPGTDHTAPHEPEHQESGSSDEATHHQGDHR